MKKYILIHLLLCIPYYFWAQGGLINNGIKVRVLANTNLKIVGGGLINQASAEINNLGNIYLSRNWIQSGAGTSYNGSGWVSFNGSNHQNISSSSPLTISKLRVNNGHRLILNSSIRLTNQLDLTNNGSIELGNNNLALNTGATITNYDVNNHIVTNGTGALEQNVATTNVVFPIGNNSYNPATLSNSGTADNFEIRVIDQVLSNGISGAPELTNVVNRTWMIEEATTGGSSVSMTLQWSNSDELVPFTRNLSSIAHWTGSYWDYGTYSSATANGSHWTQTRTGISSFSPFVVTDRSELLPIELVQFNAKRMEWNKVLLNWQTMVEINNKGFEIERMFATENSFTSIGWVDSKGTGKSATYRFIDDNNFEGTTYYRLKQIDTDGSFTHSEIRAVEGYNMAKTLHIFPNPVQDYLNIQLPNNIQTATIQIIDSKGRNIQKTTMNIGLDSFVQLRNLQQLASGFYWIRIIGDQNQTFSRKFIKR